jgi:phage-related protein
MIAKIQATPDAFDRAALATTLFGAKAGPRMAEALKPGSTSLDDIIAQLGDTAGASDKAGDAAESSFGAQFTKLMHGAGGQLASFGQNFGPLVLGFSSLLPMLTPVLTTIGGGIGGLLGLNSAAGLVEATPEISGAAGEVGTASGGVFDTLFAGAVALLPVLLIAALIAVIAILILNPDIRTKVIDFAKSVIQGILDGLKTLGNALAGAVGKAFKVVGQVIGSAMAAIGNAIGAAVQLWINIYIGIPLKIAGLIGQIPGVFIKALQAVGKIVGDGIASVVGTILSIPGKIGGLIASVPGALGGLAAAFGKIAEDMVNNFMGFILGIPDKVGSILHNIPGLSQAMDLAGGLGNLIPSFDVGTVSLERTGLIVAHAGEAIIPANLNRQIQSGQAMYGAMGAMTTAAPAKPNINIEVNNPKPEPAGQSVQTNIRRLQALGVY